MSVMDSDEEVRVSPSQCPSTGKAVSGRNMQGSDDDDFDPPLSFEGIAKDVAKNKKKKHHRSSHSSDAERQPVKRHKKKGECVVDKARKTHEKVGENAKTSLKRKDDGVGGEDIVKDDDGDDGDENNLSGESDDEALGSNKRRETLLKGKKSKNSSSKKEHSVRMDEGRTGCSAGKTFSHPRSSSSSSSKAQKNAKSTKTESSSSKVAKSISAKGKGVQVKKGSGVSKRPHRKLSNEKLKEFVGMTKRRVLECKQQVQKTEERLQNYLRELKYRQEAGISVTKVKGPQRVAPVPKENIKKKRSVSSQKDGMKPSIISRSPSPDVDRGSKTYDDEEDEVDNEAVEVDRCLDDDDDGDGDDIDDEGGVGSSQDAEDEEYVSASEGGEEGHNMTCQGGDGSEDEG